MTTVPVPGRPAAARVREPARPDHAVRRWLLAGLLTAIVDGLFSSVLAAAVYGSTVARLFQGVAATVAGPRAIGGGFAMTALGIALHVAVAFGWAGVFALLHARSPALRARIGTVGGVLLVAVAYGALVWLVMSLGVIPLLLHRPPSLTVRWWVQLVGHGPFVGLPIVAVHARAGAPRVAADD